MIILIFLTLMLSISGEASAQPARLLVPAGKPGWTNPVYSPDGNKIAFTDASLGVIRFIENGEDSPRGVASATRIGRRFVFEPNSKRIVYRQEVGALPEKPWRLVSTSLYLYDPAMKTINETGEIYGPYYLLGRVWYRPTLLSPFYDYEGDSRIAGPYLDAATGLLWIRSAKGDTVYTSPAGVTIAGMELSPDGQWVAAVRETPSRAMLLISVADGKTTEFENAFAPGWSGDSKNVICVRSTNTPPDELVRIRVPSFKSEVVFRSPKYSPEVPALNPDGSRVGFVSKGAIYEAIITLK